MLLHHRVTLGDTLLHWQGQVAFDIGRDRQLSTLAGTGSFRHWQGQAPHVSLSLSGIRGQAL